MQIIQKERAFATRDCDRYGLTGRQSRWSDVSQIIDGMLDETSVSNSVSGVLTMAGSVPLTKAQVVVALGNVQVLIAVEHALVV